MQRRQTPHPNWYTYTTGRVPDPQIHEIPKISGAHLVESYAGGDPNSKVVQKPVLEGGNLSQQVNEYNDVRAKRMTSGGKVTTDSGFATRGPREKLAQVTGKPTVTSQVAQKALSQMHSFEFEVFYRF